MITVTTPSGTMLQSTRDDPIGPGTSQGSSLPRLDDLAAGPSNALPPDSSVYGVGLDNVSIEPAVQYVQKIKQRCDEATYRRFLEILGRYHNMAEAVDEASPFCAHTCCSQVTDQYYVPYRGRCPPKSLDCSKMILICARTSEYLCLRRVRHSSTIWKIICFPLQRKPGAQDPTPLWIDRHDVDPKSPSPQPQKQLLFPRNESEEPMNASVRER